MTTTVVAAAPLNVRVTAMFGEHVIADWIGPAAQGADIQAAWSRRFGTTAVITPWPEPAPALVTGVDW